LRRNFSVGWHIVAHAGLLELGVVRRDSPVHAIRAVRESVVLVLHRIRVSSVSFVGHVEGVFVGFVSLHAPVVVLDFVPGFVVGGLRGMDAGGRFRKLAAGLSIIEECVFIVNRSFCSVENKIAPWTVRIPIGP
jgi:hypothetical protein